ncbi:winged helix-turn-helix transcriptional regulator [Croceicoccus bisphenolivorans]|uniref:winged helix-turn-helix transcriptional regulator n=1 Tax=Croceicoccus bisphenolivorans TaxID=1783232 RepID=UPI0009EEECD8|nr:helix-turn-helix domain-containing protein [Croceicoccus bisphenolivorans]
MTRSPMTDHPVTQYSDDPRIDRLVTETIGRVADKWTFLLIEALEETGPDRGARRFSDLGRAVPGISQKMLTQTLRHMEREGLVARTIYPEVPPRVEYMLTEMGHELAEAFCSVWKWAERNLDRIEAARAEFDTED